MVSVFSLNAHNYLAQKAYANTVDTLLKQTSNTLMHLDWANTERSDISKIESILSEEFDDKSGLSRFFIIKNKDGSIAYQSQTASFFGLSEIPITPEKVSFRKSGWDIVTNNIMQQHNDERILQVGIISNAEDHNQFDGLTLLALFIAIGAIGVLSSWQLSGVLFSPIKNVGLFLTTATSALDKRGILPNVPKELYRNLNKKDELRLLVEDLDSLLSKINTNHKTSRLWAAQMAHELKTPLTQLLLHLEAHLPENASHTLKSFAYIEKIKKTINAFLDWTELENNPFTKASNETYSLNQFLETYISLLPAEQRNRIQYSENNTININCHSDHLSQLIQNLVDNALKYSENFVELQIVNQKLHVKDKGPGIPEDVLEKMGDPFNFSTSNMSKKGHGLGLAWVNTICTLYKWTLEVSTTKQGTQIVVRFKSQEQQTPQT